MSSPSGWTMCPEKKTWDPLSFDYDEMTDEQREELDRFGARCTANIERTRNSTRHYWPPDNYVDSSDTDDGSPTPTGLLTPEPEARIARPPPSLARLSALESLHPPYRARLAAEYAAEQAASREARLDKAESGPVDGRPVVDFHDNTKRYEVTQGLFHDLWGTRHNTRFEKRRRSYLFALNDAGQPGVVTVGGDEPPCRFFSSTAVSQGLTKLCVIVLLYDAVSIARAKWNELNDEGIITSAEASTEGAFLDFITDYIQGPEIKRITRGAKSSCPDAEEFFLSRRKLPDARLPRKGKGHKSQRIEKRGRRPHGSGKRSRRQKAQKSMHTDPR